MIFFFAAHSFHHSRLSIFLSFTICFLVSSFQIDDTCRDYRGDDITGNMLQAMCKVQNMARNAYFKMNAKNKSPTTIRWLEILFGPNSPRTDLISTRYDAVGRRLAALSDFYHADDFVIVCDDQTAQLVIPDTLTPARDPRGVWKDDAHGWFTEFDDFHPCNPSRKPGGADQSDLIPAAYAARADLIYLCPVVLDDPLGRTLSHYKNQVLTGEPIENFQLLLFVLIHELYHTSLVNSVCKCFPCSPRPQIIF